MLLAMVFYGLWMYQRKERYLLHIIAAFLLYAVGLLMQILKVPADYGLNALVTAFVYLSAMVFLCQGVLFRHARKMPYVAQFILISFVMIGLYYFYYVDKNILARIYLLNFGCGLIILMVMPALKYLKESKLIDRILYWTFFIFSLSFFVRTPITLLIPSGDSLKERFSSSTFWLVLQVSLLFFVVFFAVVLMIVVMHDHVERLRRERDEDVLTGCLNRRGFFSAIESRIVEISSRDHFVLLVDVDYFKAINDTHGHAVGDEVLHLFAKTLREALGPKDLIGRIGGEEFAILLSSTQTKAEAIALAEHLRHQVRVTPYQGLSSGPLYFTASFGLAPFAISIDHTLQQADALLYQAKKLGRNRVEASLEVRPTPPVPACTA